jgi:hypothetical protein
MKKHTILKEINLSNKSELVHDLVFKNCGKVWIT